MLKELSTCVAAYSCDATGYDSISKKLVDGSGYGNHLDLKVGTAPIFATRDGYQVMDFDNTYYFEGDSPLPPAGSIVLVGVTSHTGGDGNLYIINTASRKALAGNFDAVPPDNSDSEWFAGTYGRRPIFFNSMSPRIFGWTGGQQAIGSAFSAGQMNMFSASVNQAPAQLQAATGAQSRQVSNFSKNAHASIYGDMLRIGHIKASDTLSGSYIALKRAYFFLGNVFEHPEFEAARAAEMAAWGIE